MLTTTKTAAAAAAAATTTTTLCLKKNDADVTYYKFNPRQPISVIYGRDVAERVCY